MVEMFSKAERRYLEELKKIREKEISEKRALQAQAKTDKEKFEETYKPSYRRFLNHQIKLKALQSFKDFPLLEYLPEKKQMIIFGDDTFHEVVSIVLLMNQKVQGFIELDKETGRYEPSHFARHQINDLVKRLEKAGLDFDFRKLVRDSDYRARLGRRLTDLEHKVKT